MYVRITHASLALRATFTCSHPSFYPRKGFQRQIRARTRIGLPPEHPLTPSRCAFRTLRPHTHERFTSQSSVRFRSRHGISPFCCNRRFVVIASSSSSSRTGPGWLITLATLHSSAHLVRRRPSSTSSASFSEVVRQRSAPENRCRPQGSQVLFV